MHFLSSLYLVRKQDTVFGHVEFQQKYHKNPLMIGDTGFTPLSQHMQLLSVQHIEKNNTHKCKTEAFVPVASLKGLVGSPYSFMSSLTGRTSKS